MGAKCKAAETTMAAYFWIISSPDITVYVQALWIESEQARGRRRNSQPFSQICSNLKLLGYVCLIRYLTSLSLISNVQNEDT